MTTNESAPVAVTAGDREAVAELLIPGRIPEMYRDAIIAGHWDQYEYIQAFARHRLAALAQPRAAMGDAMLEAFVRTQWELETIARTGATNFATIHDLVIANRAALALQSPPAAKVEADWGTHAVAWLRNRSVQRPPDSLWSAAAVLADRLEAAIRDPQQAESGTFALALQPAAQGDAAGPGA